VRKNLLISGLLRAEFELGVATSAMQHVSRVTKRGYDEVVRRMDDLVDLIQEADRRLASERTNSSSSSSAAAELGHENRVQAKAAPEEEEIKEEEEERMSLNEAVVANSSLIVNTEDLQSAKLSRLKSRFQNGFENRVFGERSKPMEAKRRRIFDQWVAAAEEAMGPKRGALVSFGSIEDAAKLACQSNQCFGIHLVWNLKTGRPFSREEISALGENYRYSENVRTAVVDVSPASAHSSLLVSGLSKSLDAEAIVEFCQEAFGEFNPQTRSLSPDTLCNGQVVLSFANHTTAALALRTLRERGSFGDDIVLVDWYKNINQLNLSKRGRKF